MGVDSGLPDFRGASGFWQVYPRFRRQRLSFKEMATPDMIRRRLTLAWGSLLNQSKFFAAPPSA